MAVDNRRQESWSFEMLVLNKSLYAHCAPRSIISITMAKEERLNLRLDPEQKQLLQRAADIENASLTEFVLRVSLREAKEAILDQQVFLLSPENYDSFVAEITDVPDADERIKRLMDVPSPWKN